jgi:hypothetical protein
VTQRKSTFPFFTKTLPIYSAAWRCRIESERRSAQGRWTKKGERTSDTIQIIVRVNPKTAGKLRAEAEQRLEEERRLRTERKRLNIGKVLDELPKHL